MVGSTMYGLFITIRKVFSSTTKTVGKAKKAADWSSDALPSLTKTIQPMIVDPRVIVSPSLIRHEKLKSVLSVLSANFSVYYIQAFNVLGNVTDLRVKKTIDDLSSIKQKDYSKFGGISVEDIDDNTVSLNSPSSEDIKNVTADNIGDVSKSLNLTSGHLLHLKVSSPDNNSTVNIPVIIKLSVSAVSSKIIRAIMGLGKLDSGFLSRIDKVRSGEISFIKDFLFAQDMVKDHKAVLMTDKTGMYADVSGRISAGLERYYKKDVKGYGAFYNMAIITASEARDIESSLGGKLSVMRHRNKLFARNYIMFIVVMDDDRQAISVYTRDIDSSTSIGYNMLDKNGMDNTDLMSLFKKVASGTPN